MLELAVKKWPVNIKDSFLIGDKKTDIECANNFGIEGFLYKKGSLLNFVKEIYKKKEIINNDFSDRWMWIFRIALCCRVN